MTLFCINTDRHTGHLTADNIDRNANLGVEHREMLRPYFAYGCFRECGPGVILCRQHSSNLKLWIVRVADIINDAHNTGQAGNTEEAYIDRDNHFVRCYQSTLGEHAHIWRTIQQDKIILTDDALQVLA